MSDQRQPDPRLLAAALSDRDRRPWRYYHIEYGELKKFTEREADRADRAEADRNRLAAENERLTRELRRLKNSHARGCPAVADDESDQVLSDYGECVCLTAQLAALQTRIGEMVERWRFFAHNLRRQADGHREAARLRDSADTTDARADELAALKGGQ